MQRLHENDLVGHLLQHDGWRLLKFPAVAEESEIHIVETFYGRKEFRRREGEALHPEREPLELLAPMREIQGEYNFAGQYQQAPSPLGGGMIKTQWFQTYTPAELPKQFDLVFQSWDTACKSTELSDYSVCTTWGLLKEHLYLLHVLLKRLDYPDFRRAVKQQADTYQAKNILMIELQEHNSFKIYRRTEYTEQLGTNPRWTRSCVCIPSAARLRTALSISRRKQNGCLSICMRWPYSRTENSTIR
jgi:hypothetical protein